ncbi:MAG: hypothetical protein AAGB34_08690, partial [Planctomycetota bacterium]
MQTSTLRDKGVRIKVGGESNSVASRSMLLACHSVAKLSSSEHSSTPIDFLDTICRCIMDSAPFRTRAAAFIGDLTPESVHRHRKTV